MAQTVAEILVDQMVEAGIRKVYGIVGDSANPIVDALRRHESDIEFVHVRNEEAGRVRRRRRRADLRAVRPPCSGRPGPGSLHLVNGLYDCQRNGAPVFAIATHIPSTEIGSGYFQETNPEAIFSGCTQLLRPDLHRRARCPASPSWRCRRPSSSAASAWSSCPATSRPRRSSTRCCATRCSPTGRSSGPRDAALDKAVRADRRRREDRDPRRRGHPRTRAPRCSGSPRRCRRRSRSPTAARTSSRPTTRPRSG